MENDKAGMEPEQEEDLGWKILRQFVLLLALGWLVLPIWAFQFWARLSDNAARDKAAANDAER